MEVTAMVTEGFENYYKLGKNFLNPWNDIGKTVLDLCRRANQGTLEIAGDNLTRTAEQLKRLSSVKRPEEIINLQKECLNENISAWMSDFQKLLNLSLNSFEEINKTFNSNLKEQQHQNPMGASGSKNTERSR
jgi:hypothetical protein